MSPTVFREGGFFFFFREESRMHIHGNCADGEAKFWLEPRVELAQNSGLDEKQVRAAQALIERSEHVIGDAWRRHFGG